MKVVNISNADSTPIDEVTLPDALEKIDPSHLAEFLKNSIPLSVEAINAKLVMYFGRALSGVSPVEYYQYPWPNMNILMDLIDLPFRHIPEPVFKTAAAWINKAEAQTLVDFISLSFECASRFAGEPEPDDPKSQLGLLAALSMIFRSRPRTLSPILPFLRPPQYHLEETPELIPFTVWMMAQVAQVDLCLGFYSWASILLPLVRDKFLCNPRSTDLIMQLIENVLSNPNARAILLTKAVRKKERLFPIPSFEILLPLTFPASFERGNVTERFVAVYPLLKEVALADETDIEKMKEFTQCVFDLSLKFAEQGNPVLANEATSIAIWCLTKNVNCCNHWVTVYMDTPKASVALLKRLVEEWKDHSRTLSSSPSDTRILNLTMTSFVPKNERGITAGGASASLYKEANKYCKEISRRLSRGNGFLKACVAIAALILVVVLLGAWFYLQNEYCNQSPNGGASALLYKEATMYSKEISRRLSYLM